MPILREPAPPVLDRALGVRAIRTGTWSPDTIARLARIATIEQVVDHAARLPPWARLRHVAFVGGLAHGRLGLDARVGRRFVELAYEATTRTAKRIATDLSRSLVWEAWEGRCLLRACAVLAGRLRVALATENRVEEWTTSAA